MLRPKKSLLAVFGVTRHIDRVRRLTRLVPVRELLVRAVPVPPRAVPRARTDARRRPSARSRRQLEPGHDAATRSTSRRCGAGPTSACRSTTADDGGVDALFRYEGTTCTNMGRPLRFDYRVTLGPREEGYPIREQ